MKILIKNCIKDYKDTVSDVFIADGVIKAVSPQTYRKADEIYDACGNYLVPAFIDIHCHLRDPGFEYKEDIESGTKAALAGGYGTVVCMPNTKPVIDSLDTLDYVHDKAAESASCRVLPAASITVGQEGYETVEFCDLSDRGAVAFTDDGKWVDNTAVMREAMRQCAELDLLIITHAEDKEQPDSEEAAVARDIALTEETGCRLHIAHVSSRGALELIRDAKNRGVQITCETCPHYFSMTMDVLSLYGSNAKINPPLRTQADVDAVCAAIADGTIDCISTDHAPHAEYEKNVAFNEAPNGIIGLQTAFAVGVTYLVKRGVIGLGKLVQLMSSNPARILNIKQPAEFNIVDIDTPFIFTKDMIVSKSVNSPFIGKKLCGKVLYTIRSDQNKGVNNVEF
jgi:dihydroorotase